MRYDRHLYRNPNDQYETLRPFIELQNHNMLNMQMMMIIAAQQNKRDCYCQSNLNCKDHNHPYYGCAHDRQQNNNCKIRL